MATLSFDDRKNRLNIQIESLRSDLHQAIIANKSNEDILALSKSLDKLISLYHNINKKG